MESVSEKKTTVIMLGTDEKNALSYCCLHECVQVGGGLQGDSQQL